MKVNLLNRTAMKLPKNISSYRDRHGVVRYRFRKVGLPPRTINAQPGTDAFAYLVDCAKAAREPSPNVLRKMRRKEAAPIPRPAYLKGEVVYFIAAGPCVKIGTTMNLQKRLYELRTATYECVEVLAVVPGGADLERHYHDKFSKARVRREWFNRSPEIEAEIAHLAYRGDPVSQKEL